MSDDQQTPPAPGPKADVWDFLDDGGFNTPPIKSAAHPEGRVYVVPSPSARVGVQLTAMVEIATKRQAKAKVSDADIARLHISDEDEPEFARKVLGSAFDEMLADGVAWPIVQRLTQYGFVYWTSGKDRADEAALAGVFSGGAAARPNRAQRRAATSGQSDRQGSTATSRTRKRRRR